jgi:hypothetical protein
MPQLTNDCLNDIIEYLENDQATLYSCILVNRIWCDISIRIFWKNVHNYSISNYNTLVACLPKKSKKILYDNGIVILPPTSDPPMFNYATFCKILSVSIIRRKIKKLLISDKRITPLQYLNDDTNIVVQELLKMFMNQVSSLKCLSMDICLTLHPRTRDCLKNLTRLCCHSNISPEFFFQLFQICHNILSFSIIIEDYISDGLADLISVQKNLKHFIITQYEEYDNNNINSLISKLPSTLIKLSLLGENCISLSFINKFSNLQILELSLEYHEDFNDFEKLLDTSFPQLRIFTMRDSCPKFELLSKFLEINGKNLKEFCIYENEKSLNLVIAKFCPNLRKLSIRFYNDELETLKTVLDNCKYLESIKILYGSILLCEKKILEAIVKHSQNIYEIILRYSSYHEGPILLPNELESFFKSWLNRIPQKSLSLMIVRNVKCEITLDSYDENMEVIRKYIKLGVIRKFKVTDFDDYFN